MLILAGLGNPGELHARHRHNVGFMAVDRLADRYQFPAFKKKFQATVSEGRIGSEKILLIKPETFMNNSGQAIGEAVRFFKLSADDVIVLYDELDLVPGKIRVKTGGGAAGHNGIRSTSAHIGDAFHRVRIGIGHPGEKTKVHGHVLGNFSRAEAEELETTLDAVAESAGWLAKRDWPRFMTDVSRRILTPPGGAASTTKEE